MLGVFELLLSTFFHILQISIHDKNILNLALVDNARPPGCYMIWDKFSDKFYINQFSILHGLNVRVKIKSDVRQYELCAS